MNHKEIFDASRCAAACALLSALPLSAAAQGTDTWKWEVAIYAYLPSVGGTTAFPVGNGSNVSVDADDVLDALNFALMGQIEARKGRWGVWSDLVYADFGNSNQNTRSFTVNGQPVTVDGNQGLDIKATVWSLAGIYSMAPDMRADLLFGTRMIDMKNTLNWSTSSSIAALPGQSGTSTVDASYWDAIIGVKGRYAFGQDARWFLPYHLDVGAGESEFTWQVSAGVGYRFGWGSMFATWRYLEYDFKSGPVQSVSFNGPVFGASFQW